MAWTNTGGNKSFRDRRVSWTCENCGRTFLSNPEDIDDARFIHHFSPACKPVSRSKDPPPKVPTNQPVTPPSISVVQRRRHRFRFHWPRRDRRPYYRYHSYSGYHRPRIRKVHSFLILWLALFFVGVLTTSVSALYLVFISLLDAAFLFVPLFILWWLSHKKLAGKIFAILLVLFFVGFVYQNPNSFTVQNLTSDFYITPTAILSSSFHSNSVNSSVNISTPPLSLTSVWVQQFMTYVNSNRSAQGDGVLSYSSVLTQFSQIRFNDAVQHYTISHYGIEQDCQSFSYFQGGCAGEVIFFPDGFTPSDYVQDIINNAPAHWQVLMDAQISSYGFYVGSGPAVDVEPGCSVTEIPGPNINVTQFFIDHGCTPIVRNTDWLVIDLF